MRKSPIKHHVRSYTKKKGKLIHDYDRGSGERSKRISKPTIQKPTLQKKQKSSNIYKVEVSYVNSRSERFTVTAKSYPDAIELGLVSRTNTTPPKSIDVRKLR